jgi:hypothetical protein
MSIPVYFRLYASNGSTLVYTFPLVQSANYPHSSKLFVEHTNLRGKGSVISDAGENSWDLTIKFVLVAANYEALTALIDTLESSIVLNTPYVLSINKTASTYYTYNVKRISAIEYAEGLRTDYQECTIIFRAGCW